MRRVASDKAYHGDKGLYRSGNVVAVVSLIAHSILSIESKCPVATDSYNVAESARKVL